MFYVQAPNFKNDPVRKAGQLELLDPRGPIAMVRSPGQVDLFTVQPKAGMIVLFPSWLYHCVNSFTLDAVRISIAFNARIDNFEPITD